ncbi:protoporphyrinogen oxidase [Capsaspora owczarzaki ATCC 30864]|uniref:Protoporphyrinogen oxidase n=1 Tax=Capsaspora owczarzaki (strain ATCC 30864) TaxID=595528 RepID=A0A0D2WUD5_CAPO3|nr:protoporphyrinogen oxidase [Capsaspora owczarzaki ATCC 30864]KJE96265.1 protoporphyrinogen oxidase, variant 1 [Capsaspora owczarzaki ATCC 30864]|eukprot:XP_004344234.2 protoporphyrinogen oxidase [Capsaspora owczarzaki ATCC 30864]
MSLSAASSATSAAAQATTTVVAVLGGGISGLAAAYYTARRLAPLHHQSEKSEHPLRRNNTRLALFERADRLGGWIHTTRDPATGALLEHGPRSIRPKAAVGEATLDLICALGIDDQVVRVPASSPAASKRYLYDQDALVALPASLGALIGSRMGRTLLARGAAEPFRPRRPTLGASITTTTTTAGNTTTTNTAATAATAAGAVHHGELAPDQDESVHQFFARRFGGEIADSLATALCRGIYAGDARELSVNACFPFLGQAERDYGSVVMGMLRAKSPKRTAEHPAFVSSFRGVSMISFREGLKTLPCALESHLESAAGVRLARSTAVSSLKLVPDGIELQTIGKDGSTATHAEHVISSLQPGALIKVLEQSTSASDSGNAALQRAIAKLREMSSVNVVTATMVFAAKDFRLPVTGFGYLVPIRQPSSVIGVIFDSCVFDMHQGSELVKITAMMGGSSYSAELDQAVRNGADAVCDLALRDIFVQLGVAPVKPLSQHVRFLENCIPQPTVGHVSRVNNIRSELKTAFGHRLHLAGAAFGGVSVNDCMASAHTVSEHVLAALSSIPRPQ